MASDFRKDYKVGQVLSIEPCGKQSSLRACQVDIGGDAAITVVTAASNVREGSRVAVAPIGSSVLTESNESMVVQRTSVGGVMSEGMFCDSPMLGWIGGANGVAAQMPASLNNGDAPPATKPRGPGATESKEPEVPAVEVKPLFEKKLTKEEKKKLAEEKRKAKKEAKEAKQAKDS